jgi:hypothetical protein
VRRRNRAVLENLLCVLLLALLPVVAFWPTLLRGTLPLDLEHILFLPPWQEARPAGMELPQEPNALQQAQVLYPQYQHMASVDSSLLWNPAQGLGTPFLALWRTRVLSPFSVPLHVLPLFPAIVLSMILKLAVAGWCAFYVARRFGFPPAMALLVAVPFQLSGPIFLWSGMPMSDVLPWLPLLLLCAERLALGHTRTWPFAAVTVALMALGGDPETFTFSMLFATLYLLGRRLRDPHNTRLTQALAGFGIALALGLALAGVQLVPYLEFIGQSSRTAVGPVAELKLQNLVAALMPSLIRPDDMAAASVSRLLHPGLVQLLLIALWIASRQFVTKQLRRRMESLLFAAVTLAVFAVVPAPIFQTLPFLTDFGPQHALIAIPLALAFLAAAAAEEWNELDPEQCKTVLARLVFVLPLVWGLGIVALIAASTIYGPFQTAVWPGVGLMLLTGLTLVLLLAFTLVRPSLRTTGYVLSTLTAICLYVAFAPLVPSTPHAAVFPETAMVQSLRAMPLPVNRISTIFNPGRTQLSRYESFMERATQDPLLQRRTGAEAFLLMKEDVKEGPFAAVRPVLHIKEVYPSGALLLRDLGAQSRVRMLYAGRRVESFDPALLNSEALPLIEGETLPESDSGPIAQARIVEEGGRRVQVEVTQTRPGVLVLADTWYPGWKATVNGTATDVFPVDGVFRGVKVPEGNATVTFTYDPISLKLGIALSLLALLAIAVNLRQILPQFRRST